MQRGNGADYNDAQSFHAPNPEYIVPKLKTIDPLSLDGVAVPERRWIVPGWIPQGSVTMLSGDGGVGKSLLTMQLLTATAIGRPWLGQQTAACRALGLFCEDDPDELHRRQAAINTLYDVGFDDLENLDFVSRVADDAMLMEFKYDKGSPTEFYQQIHNKAQDFGAQVIVIDSLHDVFAGNENARPQARQFINLLRALAMDCDGAVVLTAHPSLSGLQTGSGSSGSTAWNNAVRSRLYLTRPEREEFEDDTDDERVLARKKANYAGVGDKLGLRWENGVFSYAGGESGVLVTAKNARCESAFLAGLDALTSQGRKISASPAASNYAVKILARVPETNGVKRHELERAMERLFHRGTISQKPYGAPSKNYNEVVRS